MDNSKTPSTTPEGWSISAPPLLRRAVLFLEDGEWNRADELCEQVLNQEPENAEAYLCKLMAELHVRRRGDLADCEQSFEDNPHYKKAARFGDEALQAELNGYIACIKEHVHGNTVKTKNVTTEKAGRKRRIIIAIALFCIIGLLAIVSILWLTSPNQVLQYEENADGYTVVGCKKSFVSTVKIPAEHNGKPVTNIGNRAFDGCTNLTRVTIPDSVTNIGNYAFICCTGLTNITIPNSVTSIGVGAFGFCTSLTSVAIPNNVTSIDQFTFDGCTGLTNISIGSGVTSIGFGAFRDCTSLTSITIPDSITYIGGSAFEGCTSLTAVYITDLVKWCSIRFNGNNLANPLCYAHNLYLNNELVTEPIIPDGVTNIGYATFFGCTGLTSITIPNSVTNIGTRIFFGCTALTNITYQGTKAQWNAVSKDWKWDDNTIDYTIHCTDGDISK